MVPTTETLVFTSIICFASVSYAFTQLQQWAEHFDRTHHALYSQLSPVVLVAGAANCVVMIFFGRAISTGDNLPFPFNVLILQSAVPWFYLILSVISLVLAHHLRMQCLRRLARDV